jgi:predicted nucleotidyltransferase
MMRELTALLGRRVDLAVKPALKPLIRPGVLAEARPIYAALEGTMAADEHR